MKPEKKSRHLEFLRLFDTVPCETRNDKIRWVADQLMISDATVRIYLLNKPTRVPPKLSLRVLAEAIAAKAA